LRLRRQSGSSSSTQLLPKELASVPGSDSLRRRTATSVWPNDWLLIDLTIPAADYATVMARKILA
jgi:hypothetical protein